MPKISKKLSIKIITLFPEFVENFVESFGIVKRAVKLRLLDLKPINLRAFGLGARQVVDDRPYGGGVGMVLRPDILQRAILKAKGKSKKARVILLTPQGKPFTQKEAERLSKNSNLILVCGRYEGFDERIRAFVDEEISIGDYVLMGGELPALILSEAVMRLRPGILGKDESADKESFAEGLLEYPQYTKPEIWKAGKKIARVPKVLLSGNHRNIAEWRLGESLKRTEKRRPDIFKKTNVL
jgi:tRNA (guanine37-N1)-methyltransferase